MQTDSRRFAQRVAIVTGAARGLGLTLASQLAAEGATVYAVDLALPPPVPAAGAGSGEVLPVQMDVTVEASWDALVERVGREHGQLHVLVNCAGVVNREGIRGVALSTWEHVLNVNLTGSMLAIRSSAPLMRDSGGGSVVNIGSTAGMSAHPGVAYCTSKWGLRGLTVSAALELLEWGIRVNAVHPVQIQGTGITTGASPGWRFAQERALPMQRGVTTQEVTQAVLFLASDAASYITGTDLPVDGGVLSTGIARVRTVLQEEFEKTHGKGNG